MVYVISRSGKALMPTGRGGHIRRLLNKGKARIISHVPFVVQLMYDTPEKVQPLSGGTDPGRTNIGESIVSHNGLSVYQAHVETRNKDIPRLMAERKDHRQASRHGERQRRKRRARRYGTAKEFPDGRILPGYKDPVMLKGITNTEAKFNCRTRDDGWITPTVRQLVQTHLNMADRIRRILPVSDWTLEVNRFAFMRMDDGTCYGTDFQNGRMKGYASVEDYVYARQDGRCLFCGAPIEHIHHLIPRHEGGSSLPGNLVGVCRSCHEKIHTGALVPDVTGVQKKYGALSALNQAIPYILKGLADRFGEEHVHVCFGYETQTFAKGHGLGKAHDSDAYAIACLGAGINPAGVCSLPDTFEVRQFRRHDRQRIHAQRERTYKLDGVTVCKNRHRRFEQKDLSLEEYAVNHPEDVPRLTVSKSRRYYKDSERLMPGAVFWYRGTQYVLTGQLSGGTQYRAYGCGKKNFFAKQCYVTRKNKGLVYVA